MVNLRNLAEQRKNQHDLKNKYRFLKQTQNIKIAENLSPITKKVEEVNEPAKNLGNVNEKSQSENNIPQPTIEHTAPYQPIENNEGVIYDTELEITKKNMKNNTGFFKTNEDPERGWIWNGYPIKILDGTKVEINDKNFKMTPGVRKV